MERKFYCFSVLLFTAYILYSCKDDNGVIDSGGDVEVMEEVSGELFTLEGGVLCFESFDLIDSLSESMTMQERAVYFKGYGFKSALSYYSDAMDLLCSNDNTEEFYEGIKGIYPGCIGISREDSCINVYYTFNARSLAWVLNADNQVRIGDVIYTFSRDGQTLYFLNDDIEEPKIEYGDIKTSWANNTLEIVCPRMKSLITVPGVMLVRGYAWDGKHRLQAALSIEHYLIYNPTKYNSTTGMYETRQIRRLWVSYQQDRQMWYGWTKKYTNFTYTITDLYILSTYGAWVDQSTVRMTNSIYDTWADLMVFSKKRVLEHSNLDLSILSTWESDIKLRVSAFVKSGQVPAGFTLEYDDFPIFGPGDIIM